VGWGGWWGSWWLVVQRERLCAFARPGRAGKTPAVPGVGRWVGEVGWGVGGWWSNGSGFCAWAQPWKSRQDAGGPGGWSLGWGGWWGSWWLVVQRERLCALRGREEPARCPPEAVPGVGRWVLGVFLQGWALRFRAAFRAQKHQTHAYPGLRGTYPLHPGLTYPPLSARKTRGLELNTTTLDAEIHAFCYSCVGEKSTKSKTCSRRGEHGTHAVAL
jgi:hypothetical protein